MSVEFRRVAVTEQQIAEWNLPTRSTKITTHSRGWSGGDSVEIDTIRTADLKALVEREIKQVIDPHQWQRMLAIEQEERLTLRQMIGRRAA